MIIDEPALWNNFLIKVKLVLFVHSNDAEYELFEAAFMDRVDAPWILCYAVGFRFIFIYLLIYCLYFNQESLCCVHFFVKVLES